MTEEGARASKDARKARRAKDQAALQSAVEDATRFLFEIDGAPQAIPATDTRPRKAPADPVKPHFHDHRARLRQRFEDGGAGALADYELLELLLFRVIPRKDTKPLAKALLDRFKDLSGVLAAPPRLIAEVDGAGAAVAQELKVLQAFFERAAKSEITKRPVIGSWSQLISYCRAAMQHEGREQFRVLFLDTKNQLIQDEVLNRGTVDHAPVYPREVARRALELSAASVILVHNHPTH